MQEKIILERNNRGDKIFLLSFFLVASAVMAECTRFCLISYRSEIPPMLFWVIPAEKLQYGSILPSTVISLGGFLVCVAYFAAFAIRGIPYRIAVDSASVIMYFDGLTKFRGTIPLSGIKSFTSVKNRRAYTISAVLRNGRKKTVLIINGGKQDPSPVLKALKDSIKPAETRND